LCGGVPRYVAQATPQFDAEIVEKGHLWMETSYRGEKKGGPALKKIVIVSSEPEPDECLLELVKTLFPDCEICVVSGMAETRV